MFSSFSTLGKGISTVTGTAISIALFVALCTACAVNPDSDTKTDNKAEHNLASEVLDNTSATSTSPTGSSAPTALPQAARIAPILQPVGDLRLAAANLMMVGVRDYDDALWALQQGVGGIFLSSTTNPELLTTPGRDIAALRAAIGRDFDVSIDFEGGRVLRFADILGYYPAPGQMAATMSVEQVRALAQNMGSSLAARGITVDFAPVVDLDGAGLEVVGDRAFSADPYRAADYAVAFAQGLIDANVTPVFKHFPGHGRASGDTHLGQAITPPLAELQQHDLLVYHRLAEFNNAAVMVGHLVVPDLGELPASINPAVYSVLRSGQVTGGVPFSGVVYTDDLSGMKAMSDRMSLPEAVSASLIAGADRALWISTAGLSEAIDAVVRDVESGMYPYRQFAQSVHRVRAATAMS
ncbi:glycoside hydrolase family 3 N-terminal domain-containing protein [Corynebacterium kutscheri]|uniref:glycoside hydrolase family 3 N-terminal domain-containing protein n=1 Tax=Corynebacterium kutscheri TaxID=35755 RepID=UPI0037C068F7